VLDGMCLHLQECGFVQAINVCVRACKCRYVCMHVLHRLCVHEQRSMCMHMQ